jgi:hypothetical protein
MGGALGM